MQQHVKEHVVFHIADGEKVLQHRQMAGARDRQKLRHALHQPQQNGIPIGHRQSSKVEAAKAA